MVREVFRVLFHESMKRWEFREGNHWLIVQPRFECVCGREVKSIKSQLFNPNVAHILSSEIVTHRSLFLIYNTITCLSCQSGLH